MRLPPLFRRRRIWVPTGFGTLLICAALLLFAFLVTRNLYEFLSYSEPLEADVVVIEGWMPEEALAEVTSRYRESLPHYLVASGGPIRDRMGFIPFESYAELTASYLVREGMPADVVVAVPAPASMQGYRTYLSAIMVRKWIEALPRSISTVDVVTYGPHARRSHLLFQLALGPRYEVGVVSVAPRNYGATNWWKSSEGTKRVLVEAIAWLWTKCCFGPGEPGSPEEMWGG